MAAAAAFAAGWPRSEGGLQVDQRDHQRQGIERGRLEAELHVKALGVVGERMRDQPANADGVGRLQHAQSRIAHQRPADTPALQGTVDGQTGEHHDGTGSGRLRRNRPGASATATGTGRERIVGQHARALADDKVRDAPLA